MSVHGEFQRLLAELVSCLRATQHAVCERAADALEASAAAAREDLSGAASRALAVCASPPLAELSAEQRAEVEERCAHLNAVCRAVLG